MFVLYNFDETFGTVANGFECYRSKQSTTEPNKIFNFLEVNTSPNMLIIALGILTALSVLISFVVIGWYYRYRFISFIRHEHTSDMDSRAPEGYTDKAFYYPGETITFFLHSKSGRNRLSLRRMIGPFQYHEVFNATFGQIEQTVPVTASEQGCDWEPSLTITIGPDFKAGYYQALLEDEVSTATFAIYLIIGGREPGTIVIVAPISTWTAYNPWGGKSLYQNRFEDKTVYFVSTQRPNTAFDLNHSIDVEANTFNWFSKTYPNVSIIPDYFLEDPKNLQLSELLVLSYHCEYISKDMHRTVRALAKRGVSFISLGANQLYWVVRWNSKTTRMECRKDVTFFEHTFAYGGMWKHHFHPQQKYLAGRYNASGMHTFAPYKLIAIRNHWILSGLTVEAGEIFGMASIDGKPICGSETDKTTHRGKNIEMIAHGLNCEDETVGIIYDPADARWNGSGGGEMTIGYRSNGSAVLNTAAIHSGAGLGVDSTFTGIIQNFVRRFGPNEVREGVFSKGETLSMVE